MNNSIPNKFGSYETYDKEMLTYFLDSEKIITNSNFFNNIHNSQITTQMIEKLLIWMIEFCDQFNFDFTTKQSSLIYVYEYLGKQTISIQYLQLLGMNFKEYIALSIENILFFAGNQYNKDEFHKFEFNLLKTLNFKLNEPLPGEIYRVLLNMCVENINDDIFERIDDTVSFCLTTNEFLSFPLKIISISCLFYHLLKIESFDVFDVIVNILKLQNIDMKLIYYFNSLLFPILENAIQEPEKEIKNTNEDIIDMNKFVSPPSKTRKIEEESTDVTIKNENNKILKSINQFIDKSTPETSKKFVDKFNIANSIENNLMNNKEYNSSDEDQEKKKYKKG